MIRNARHQDIPEIMRMLHEMHAASKYRGRVNISDKAADALLTSAIASQGQSGPQGSHVIIAEEGGKIVGFMIGVLTRVEHIGDKLTANDLFLYVRPGNGVRHVLALIDSYIAWASSKRPVLDIMLSWKDTLPGAEQIEAIYKRKGFARIGGIFGMRCDEAQEIAA